MIDIHTHSPLPAHEAIKSLMPSELVAEKATDAPQPRRLRSVGVHPWATESDISEELKLLPAMAERTDVVAIGETGLDSLRGAPIEVQKGIFREHVALSEKLHKPLVLHVVRRWDDILAIRKEMRPRQPWIAHGFRGNASLARQLIDAGLYLSFGEKFNPDALRAIPLERIFAETDESVLSVSSIMESLAAALHITPDALAEQIRKNFSQVFPQ